MRALKFFLAAAAIFVMAAFLPGVVPQSHAQISIGVHLGPEPVCPYGYYGYAPYGCAPYGYYGPEWFVGGRFVGAGGWYHGGDHFYGHVNRAYDPRYGYHGAYPAHGAYVEHPDHFKSFQGTHYSDEHGSYHTEDEHQTYGHR